MTVLVHLPYEFYQTYFEKAGYIMGISPQTRPILTGVHLAVTMLISSLFTRFGKGYHHRCRVKHVLIGCAAFRLLIIGMMALVVHPVIIVLLMARTVSKAISRLLQQRKHRQKRPHSYAKTLGIDNLIAVRMGKTTPIIVTIRIRVQSRRIPINDI